MFRTGCELISTALILQSVLFYVHTKTLHIGLLILDRQISDQNCVQINVIIVYDIEFYHITGIKQFLCITNRKKRYI